MALTEADAVAAPALVSGPGQARQPDLESEWLPQPCCVHPPTTLSLQGARGRERLPLLLEEEIAATPLQGWQARTQASGL